MFGGLAGSYSYDCKLCSGGLRSSGARRALAALALRDLMAFRALRQVAREARGYPAGALVRRLGALP